MIKMIRNWYWPQWFIRRGWLKKLQNTRWIIHWPWLYHALRLDPETDYWSKDDDVPVWVNEANDIEKAKRSEPR